MYDTMKYHCIEKTLPVVPLVQWGQGLDLRMSADHGECRLGNSINRLESVKPGDLVPSQG